MFNTVSWQAYWICLALISSGYYLLVYLLYFRNDVKISIFDKSGPFPEDAPSSVSAEDKGEPTKAVLPSLFGEEVAAEFSFPPKGSEEHVVYSCMDELNAFFEAAKKRKWSKHELLNSLKMILKKYSVLKNSEYKESINNVLVTECEHHCSIHLSAEEVLHVWLD